MGAGICSVSSSHMDARRAVNFPICLAFYLLGQSGGFQASYMWHWKPSILNNFILIQFTTINFKLVILIITLFLPHQYYPHPHPSWPVLHYFFHSHVDIKLNITFPK